MFTKRQYIMNATFFCREEFNNISIVISDAILSDWHFFIISNLVKNQLDGKFKLKCHSTNIITHIQRFSITVDNIARDTFHIENKICKKHKKQNKNSPLRVDFGKDWDL